MEVIVIGGSAAGLKAACRISRLQPDASVKVLVKDRHFGVSTCGLTFFLSGEIDSYTSLVSTPNGTIKDEKYYRDVKGIEVVPNHEVTAVDRVSRAVRCINHENQQSQSFPYDKLVIATGSKPINPAIPGIDTPGITHFTTLDHAIQLRQDLQKGLIDKVAIVGAGFIGLELCEALRSMWGVEVDLIELQPQVLAGLVDREIALLIEEELVSQGVKIRLGCRCSEILRDEGSLCVFDLAGERIDADRLIIASGVTPDVSLAKNAGLEIGASGGISVNDHLCTSDPDIFAAGDCVELSSAIDGSAGVWTYGSLASRMGRVVGDNICNGDSVFGSVLGTTVLKLFDLTIGSVGMTSVESRNKGYDIGESWGTFHDRLFYYPESVHINAKLICDKSSGNILGVQAVTRGNLVHIIDAASLMIQHKVRIDSVADYEHAYSPPYAQPLDPLHYLVFISENSRAAGIKLVSPLDFGKLSPDTLVLDTRSPHEIESRPLEINGLKKVEIPVEDLRNRINELPAKTPVVTVCQMGSRGWDAALMLRRSGWSDVGILAGGALFLSNSTIG